MVNFKKILQNLTIRICLVVLISRACIFFFGMWGHQVFPEYKYVQNQGIVTTEFISPEDKGKSLRDTFGKFDSGYYLQIINSGYSITNYSDDAKKVWAFMPLYPVIINAVTFFSTDPDTIFITGIIISNLLFLISCILVKHLLRLFDKEKYALKTVLLLCFFPGSIYFSFFYTEALFLFLSIAAAIFIKKKRWFAAALFIGLLGITRKIGLFFIIPFAIEFFRYNSFKRVSNIWKNTGTRNWPGG